MIGLLPYIEQIILLANRSSSERRVEKGIEKNAILWLCAILGGISYILIMAGLILYFKDSHDYGPALLAVGMLNISIGLFLVAILQAYKRIKRKKFEATCYAIQKNCLDLLSGAFRKADDEFKDHALLMAAVSAGLGFIISRKIF